MYQLLAKKGQLFAIILGVAVVAIFLGSVFSGLGSSGYSLGDDLNQIMKDNPGQTFDFFNPGIMLTGVLIAVGIGLALLFGIVQLLSAPKQSMKAIIGMLVIAAAFFAFYSTSTSGIEDPFMNNILGKFDVSENVSKLISGGIMTTLVLGGLAFAAMILAEVGNLFK